MNARQVVVWLLVVAFSCAAALFLGELAGDMVPAAPGTVPTTYGYPGPR